MAIILQWAHKISENLTLGSHDPFRAESALLFSVLPLNVPGATKSPDMWEKMLRRKTEA